MVGGWATYEVARRQARWEAVRGSVIPKWEQPGSRYRPLTHVGAKDVASSVLASTSAGSTAILRRAALRMAAAVGAQESRHAAGVLWELQSDAAFVVPRVTARELREFANSAPARTDIGSIEDMSVAIEPIAAAVGVTLPGMPPAHGNIPAMRTRVPVEDDDAIIELEVAAVPLIETLAAKQAALATQLDMTAIALEDREQQIVKRREQNMVPGC